MFASNAWIYLLTLTLVTCIASRDHGAIQGPPQHHGSPGLRSQNLWLEGPDALTKKDTEQITKSVNMIRQLGEAANMNMVGWEYTSAIRAQELAEGCDSTESENSKKLPNIFHNIKKYYVTPGTREELDPLQLFNRWFEEMYVNYTVYDCKPKHMCDVGNKVLLARSRVVGCAIKTCDPALTKTTLKKGKLLVCSFVNMPSYAKNRETPGLTYIKGKACSKCGKRQPLCINKLCASYAFGLARSSDAARPVPAHPSAILIAMATGLAMTAVGTRLVDV